MEEVAAIQPGRYRHYKGQEYTVLGTARHSETEEDLVIYRQEYGEHGIWVRPKQMFAEMVMIDGRLIPRFQKLETNVRTTETSRGNIFTSIPHSLPQEVVQALIENDSVRVERIISQGHVTPTDFWYDQPEHEWVIVLKGRARLQIDSTDIELKPGDFINIPAHTKHKVTWTTDEEPTIWLAVFYKSREFTNE